MLRNPTTDEDRSWFEFLAAARDDDPVEILIYDYIGSYGVSAANFDRDLKAMGVPKSKKATMRINSPGGETPTAASMYNMMERWLTKHEIELTVVIDGIAASAASWIAMLGDEIVMPENTLMMIHDPSGFAMGTSRDMRSLAAVLDRIKQGMVLAYMKKSGQSKEDIEAIMEAETWYDAQEAVDAGFADRVDNPIDIAAAISPTFEGYLQHYKNPPDSLEYPSARIGASTKEGNMPKPNETPAEMEARLRAELTASINADNAAATAAAALAAKQVVPETPEAMQARIRGELQASVAEVNSLCIIAGKPELAGGFIAEGKSVADVRAALEAAAKAPKPTDGKTNALNTHAGADAKDDAGLTVSSIDTGKVWANYNQNKGTAVKYDA